MFNRKFASLPLAAATFALLPAAASAATPSFRSFGDVEFRSNPAALIEEVREGIAAHVQPGSPIAAARAFLGDAGAHCGAAKADGSIRCRYYGVHFQGDVVNSVSWTVNLATANEKVTSFAVERMPASD